MAETQPITSTFTPFTWPWRLPPPMRRRWRRYWIDDPLFGLLYLALHHGCRFLPIEWCSSIGAALGLLSWRFGRRQDRMRMAAVYAALTAAKPDKVDAVIRRLFADLGRVALEYATLDRLWARGRIGVSGAEHLLGARGDGAPVIVLGLHLANWEIIAPALIGLGLHGCEAFYQPRRSRFENAIIVAARERYGVRLLRPGVAAARRARRLLTEERGVLLIYADEERRGRVSAPRFGRPLPERANLHDVARLSRLSGAPIVPAYAERVAGARFRVNFLPPIDLAPDGPGDDIDLLDRTIEPIVLAHLDHWYMLTEETVAITGPGFDPNPQP